jgi:hypothetical protein
MISILDTGDPDAVREYERAFYTAFRRATAHRLVRKLWLWNDDEGRVATRIPYADQRIYTLRDRAGAISAALAANVAMREFQSAAFGFNPAEPQGAVEVLTFFSTAAEVRGTTRLFRGFVEDTRASGRHTALATTAERPFRVYRRIGWELVAECEIESERRYFLRFDLRRGEPPGDSRADLC